MVLVRRSALVKDLMMTDTQQLFEKALRTLGEVESLMSGGHDINSASEKVGVASDTIKEWANHLSLPQDAGDVLTSSRLTDAVFPIFAAQMPGWPLEHVGSGVAVFIGEELFALSAAHVTDHAHGDGELYMPAVDAIEQMTGGLSYNPIPDHGSRVHDKGDIAYYHLSAEWRKMLHPAIRPLTINDLMLTDELETGDIFTFAGYPWRKTKSRHGKHETDRTTYTGHASAPDIYAKLGYSRIGHIVVRLRRKKTYSTRHQSYQTAPHPQGISGGAVIAWPWTFSTRHNPSLLKLAAIGNTYHQSENCMAATRIIPYVMAIIRNNPDLAVHFDGHESCEELAMFLSEIGC